MWQIRRRAEKILLGIVWRLPRRLVYWCAIRLMVKMIRDNESPGDVTVEQVLRRADGWA
jgi:hypothetical protein